jgi:hypothetical protein
LEILAVDDERRDAGYEIDALVIRLVLPRFYRRLNDCSTELRLRAYFDLVILTLASPRRQFPFLVSMYCASAGASLSSVRR